MMKLTWPSPACLDFTQELAAQSKLGGAFWLILEMNINEWLHTCFYLHLPQAAFFCAQVFRAQK